MVDFLLLKWYWVGMNKMSDSELWEVCRKYGGNARMWVKKFVALLPEVEKRKLYKKHGFYSIYEFAAKVGGVGTRVVDEVLRLDKKLCDRPILRDQIAEIGWSKVNVIASVTTADNQVEMVSIAKTLNKSALESYVRDTKGIDANARSREATPGCKLQSVTFKIDKETQFLLKQYQRHLEKKYDEPIPLGKVLKTLLKKVQEPMKEPRPSIRQVVSRNPSVRTKYERSNGGKCAFPNCNKPYNHFHHPNRYALDHSHANIVPLCEEHHQIAHAGLIANEKSSPEEWILRDKMMPNFVDLKYQVYAARAGP